MDNGFQKIYNSPLELGIRSLMILNHLRASVDLDYLMYIDHLSLNTSDISGPESLHAPIPRRGIQAFARREIIRKGIIILLSKQLINVTISNFGVLYEINQVGRSFLGFFGSEYYLALNQRIKWVTEKFVEYRSSDLEKFVSENLEKWGGEYIYINEIK